MMIKKRKDIGLTCVMVAFAVLLTGCNVMYEESTTTDKKGIDMAIEADEAELMEEVEQDMETGEEMQVCGINRVAEADRNSDISNNIYNSVKYYNEYFYFSDVDGFRRMDKNHEVMETLAEGNVRLGNCDENFIYYIRTAKRTVENPGVFRMNLTDFVEEKIMEWSESMWGVNNIYAYQNIVYFEGNHVCEAYELINGKLSQAVENNILYQKLDKCCILREEINELVFGYVSIMFQYHKLVCLDREENRIIVYDVDSGESINTINNCGSDILVCGQGIVYKDSKKNILLREWNDENDVVLYDISEHGGKIVNYGTFDKQYIYGFYENSNECTLVKISWAGVCETSRTFEGVDLAVELGFSANNGVISFLQDGRRIFEKEERNDLV